MNQDEKLISRSTYSFKNRSLLVADEVMKKTVEMAERAARTDATVLLCGESGTGKELVARFIHEMSRRQSGPFVSVNCAAIPEGLMEAELFGYEKGAFTEAIAQRIGKFERANGGTLLLDEISEMPISLQSKLLRVLQESEVDRLGARDAIKINTRIIATTNRNPLELIQKEKFREDLYFRLNVIRIDCQPLRGRYQAITELASYFLQQACERHERPGVELTPEAFQKLRAHSWPGNIRELHNAIERAVVNGVEEKIRASELEFLKPFLPVEEGAPTGTLASLERKHILSMLDQADGNRTEAAKKLGISIRTLRNKLKDYSAA